MDEKKGEQGVQMPHVFVDFSELVWPIGACKVPKFAKLNLQTLLFYDPMAKNAKKYRLLAIFYFANEELMVEQGVLNKMEEIEGGAGCANSSRFWQILGAHLTDLGV